MFSKVKHYIDYLRLKAASGQSSLPVVFVVGAPRSGTTLLQDRISRHSSLFSVNAETGFFARDNVWRRASRWKGLRGEAIKETSGRSLVEQFESFVAAAARISGADGKRFVEKTPHHILQIEFILKSFPNARFVHIVRDPRACFSSGLSHPNIQQKDVRVHAKYWENCLKSRLAVGASDQIFDVTYRSFVTDPKKQLTNIMEFLDCEFEPTQLDLPDESEDPRAKLDHFQKLARPITVDGLDSWQEKLPEQTKEYIESKLQRYIDAVSCEDRFGDLLGDG